MKSHPTVVGVGTLTDISILMIRSFRWMSASSSTKASTSSSNARRASTGWSGGISRSTERTGRRGWTGKKRTGPSRTSVRRVKRRKELGREDKNTRKSNAAYPWQRQREGDPPPGDGPARSRRGRLPDSSPPILSPYQGYIGRGAPTPGAWAGRVCLCDAPGQEFGGNLGHERQHQTGLVDLGFAHLQRRCHDLLGVWPPRLHPAARARGPIHGRGSKEAGRVTGHRLCGPGRHRASAHPDHRRNRANLQRPDGRRTAKPGNRRAGSQESGDNLAMAMKVQVVAETIRSVVLGDNKAVTLIKSTIDDRERPDKIRFSSNGTQVVFGRFELLAALRELELIDDGTS